MIYLLLFYEFFKVGLFAIGGGLVTVPFLFDLSAKYSWFTTKELADMIAISESMPGPLGVEYGYFRRISCCRNLGRNHCDSGVGYAFGYRYYHCGQAAGQVPVQYPCSADIKRDTPGSYRLDFVCRAADCQTGDF